MSKRNKSSASKKKKAGSLAYQIKKLELRRKGKDKPMLAKTEQQYKKHALKFAEYCKSTYRCKTLEECKSHIQDYANYLTASGKTASTTHTYLASICRVFDIPLSDIKKPIRVVAHNTRSRGRKAVDERKDAGRYECAAVAVAVPYLVKRWHGLGNSVRIFASRGEYSLVRYLFGIRKLLLGVRAVEALVNIGKTYFVAFSLKCVCDKRRGGQ